MRKAFLQNQMLLDILTAALRGTCAVVKAECCVYIHDPFPNISITIQDIQWQFNAALDSEIPWTFFLPTLWEAIIGWFWWKYLLPFFIIVLLILLFDLCILNCFFDLVFSRLKAICLPETGTPDVYQGPLQRLSGKYLSLLITTTTSSATSSQNGQHPLFPHGS